MSDAPTVQDHLASATRRFAERFGRVPRFAAAAPGRVNLIGEHTDYNDGFVLPMAIERQTIALADRSGRRGTVCVVSTSQPEQASFALHADLKPGQPQWANYVKGVLVLALREGLSPLAAKGGTGGDAEGGLDILIDTNVPLGGGLSSSASLEVAVATLVEAMVGRSLEPAAKALLCQKAEHTFAGVPCGIMDQFIAAMGRRGHALLLDCASRATRLVPLADPSVCVLIANTNRKHELVGGEYAQRRAQCEKAAKALGVPSLRHARVEQLSSAAASLDPLSLRRARHVIGEITRTTQAAQMMTRQRWDAVGQLMYESHASLRDDFQVSTPELDLMVELARGLGLAGGVYGSRMTGGGFGGCTVTLVQSHQLDAVRGHLQSEYQRRTGIEPTLFATSPAEGARVLDLAAR